MMQQDVDLELVRQVQAGNRHAFDALVMRYQFKMTKLVARYVHDQTEVHDVVQEAFIRAYRALENFRGDSAFYSWLYRIAINTAKNYLLTKERRPPAVDIDFNEAEERLEARQAQQSVSPERLMMRDEVETAVFKAVDSLPDDLRTAIVLRELAGLSYEEIAATVQCPVGTVRSRLYRAREAIVAEISPLISNFHRGEQHD